MPLFYDNLNDAMSGIFRSSRVDPLVGGQVIVDTVHSELHAGNMFIAAGLIAPHGGELANDGTATVFIVTGTSEAHATWAVRTGGDVEYTLAEGGTITANGTELNSYNMYRGNAGTALTKIYHGGTSGGGWTNLPTYFVPGGAGPLASGGIDRQGLEWILDASTNYRMQVINRSGAAQMIGISVEFYEE